MKILLNNLSKNYNEVKAIQDLSIEIPDGKLVCLLGPSGCGKSTTLSIIAGLENPDIGTVLFNEEDMEGVEPENRRIGMVFQNYALYPHMTVKKNLGFPLKMKKQSKKEIERKVIQISKLCHIQELLNRKPKELSGGQMQRVAIGRAMIKEPDILLLDEPLSNLDAKLRIEMREEIKRIQKATNITTVFVTHDQEEAMSIADFIVVLDGGKLKQYDTPKNLYKTPANIMVAEFLGNPSMTIIDKPYWIKDKEKYKCGIRPEDIEIIKKGTYKKAKNEMKINTKLKTGIITQIQILGKDQLIEINHQNNKIKILDRLERDFSIGEKIEFEFRKCHYFSTKSGERIEI